MFLISSNKHFHSFIHSFIIVVIDHESRVKSHDVKFIPRYFYLAIRLLIAICIERVGYIYFRPHDGSLDVIDRRYCLHLLH